MGCWLRGEDVAAELLESPSAGRLQALCLHGMRLSGRVRARLLRRFSFLCDD